MRGRTLGDFVLIEPIGKGGFGTVYLAKQSLLEREVVVKVLHSPLSASDVPRFFREARLASQLDHPYAAHVYAYGSESDGITWIAMEHVRGTPLHHVLAERGPMPLERFVPLFERICEVVDTAHEQGIVHRDLKPANVMVISRASKLLPKLIDFGLAKMVGETQRGVVKPLAVVAGGADLTPRGHTVGSPVYMAPELWDDSVNADHRADLYALGVLAYEALTGRVPFTGTSLTSLAIAHTKKPVPPVGEGFPVALDAVFQRALAKDPAERFPNAVEMAAAMRAAAAMPVEEMPVLEEDLRVEVLGDAPQPIAEAVAVLETARTTERSLVALQYAAGVLAQWLGILALACRTRGATGEESSRALGLLRKLRLERLSVSEWLALAVELAQPFAERREVHPVPELVGFLTGPGGEALGKLLGGPPDGEPAIVVLRARLLEMARILRELRPVSGYTLVVPRRGLAEAWSGTRRVHRATVTVARDLPDRQPALVDRDGTPVLSLWPLVQVAPPAPGDAPELFVLDGWTPRGARLASFQGPDVKFERRDDTLHEWFGAHLVRVTGEETAIATEDERAPYRGLSAFTLEDADLYFGRESDVEEFANRLRVSPRLAVVGPSGAGKSSFVMAGVMPHLPEGWTSRVVRPGPTPMAALAARLKVEPEPTAILAALRQAAGDGVLVLVVDQFEEIVTMCLDPEERLRYVELLTSAAQSLEDPLRVVLTLRDDFLIRIQQLEPLRKRLAHTLALLGTPAEDDLLRILTEPARRAGYVFEDPALPREMVRDVADRPGALALLSFTAARLWELRDRHFKRLTRRAYEALGGVGGALGRHAEETLEAIGADDQPRVREAFRHLVSAEGTRATLTRRELLELLGGGERAERVLERLIGSRLLLAGESDTAEDRVEVIHEALITSWPRLDRWRREDAESARLRDQLRAAARQWAERGRQRGLLWRGEALLEYRLWRARYPGALTEAEEAFGRASLDEEARGRRVRRILVGAAISILTIGVLALWSTNRRAVENAGEAHRRLVGLYAEQGRQELLAGHAMRASVYLSEAYRQGGDRPLLQFLLGRAVESIERQEKVLEGHHDRVHAVAWSPDGSVLASGGEDDTVILWADGKARATLAHPADVYQLAFSADGATLATGGYDGDVRLWDVATGAQRLLLAGKQTEIPALAYRADGVVVSGGADGTIHLWDGATGTTLATVTASGHGLHGLAVAPDGKIAAATKEGAKIWDRTGHLLQTVNHDDTVVVAFSNDGTRLLAGEYGGAIRVWNVQTGQPIGSLFGHAGVVNAVAFAPSGTIAASAGNDQTARVWDLAKLEARATLSGHQGRVMTVHFTPDERRLITTSQDTTARVWDVATGKTLAVLEGNTAEVFASALSPDGKTVATGGFDGTVRLFEARRREPLSLEGHAGEVRSASFTADGRIVTAGEDGTVRLWDAKDGRALLTVKAHAGGSDAGVWRAYVDPTGRRLVTASDDGTAKLFDATDGKLLQTFAHEGAVFGAAWSPDGGLLATCGADGVRLWDPATGTARGVLRGHAKAVWGVTFDATGTLLASASDDHQVILWDLATQKARTAMPPFPKEMNAVGFDPSGRWLATGGEDMRGRVVDLQSGLVVATLDGHSHLITSVSFSPDGKRILTSSLDGTARVWDLSGKELAVLDGHGDLVYAAGFSPDGTRIVTAGADGVARVWDVPLETRPPEEMARFVACHVPYVLRDGRPLATPPDPHACTR